MKENSVKCIRTCKNTCTMLNEALRREASLVRYYERLLEQCNFPDDHSLVFDLVESKRNDILSIIRKLNEIHAHSEVLNEMYTNFNNVEG